MSAQTGQMLPGEPEPEFEIDTVQNPVKPKKREWTKLEDEIASAIIYRRSRATMCGSCIQRSSQDLCFGRRYLSGCYWRTAFCALSALIMFIGFTFGLSVPSLQTINYLTATCSTLEVNHVSDNSCQYGTFPCLVVTVTYMINEGQFEYIRGRGKLYDVEFGGPCSFKPPCRHETTNREAVKDWRKQLRGTFDCFVEPPTQDEIRIGGYVDQSLQKYIMLKRRLNVAGAVNLMFWPLLVCIMLLVALIIMCCTCGCGLVCENHPPEEITECMYRLVHSGHTLDSLQNMDLDEWEATIWSHITERQVRTMLKDL